MTIPSSQADVAPSDDPPATVRQRPGTPRGARARSRGSIAGTWLGRTLAHALEYYGVGLLLVPLIIVFSTQNENFMTWDNWLNVLRQISIFAILGVGMTYVMIMAQIDLSVGSLTALTGVVAASAFNEFGGLPAALAGALLVGAAVGAFNGTVTVRFAVPSLLVTLGSLQMVRGLALASTDGQGVTPEDAAFLSIGNDYWLGIPIPVWVMLAVVLVGWIGLTQTVFGRHIYAVGGNREAARRSGIHVRRTIIYGFIVSGACAGLAGLLLASRLAGGQPNVGVGYELFVIAAVVLGGTSLFGGRGTIFGSLLGALVIGVLQNGMDLLTIAPFWQIFAIGAVITLALIVDSVRANKLDQLSHLLRGTRVR